MEAQTRALPDFRMHFRPSLCLPVMEPAIPRGRLFRWSRGPSTPQADPLRVSACSAQDDSVEDLYYHWQLRRFGELNFRRPRCERDVLRKRYLPGHQGQSGTRGRCRLEPRARTRRGCERRPCATVLAPLQCG